MSQVKFEPNMRVEDVKRQLKTMKFEDVHEYCKAEREAIIAFNNADKNADGLVDEVEIQNFDKKVKICDKMGKLAEFEILTVPALVTSLIVAAKGATKNMRRGFGIASVICALLSATPLVADKIDPRK